MSAPILHAREAQDLFCNSFRAYAPGLCPPFVAGYSVALTVTIPIAEVDPLPAVIGPYLLPAPFVTIVVAHSKRRTKKRKVAEMVMPEEDAVPEREVVESVTGETLASEGYASKAPCSGHKRAPAGNHAPMETAARETTEMRSTPSKAAAEVHSATTEPTVHATKSTTAAKCHCWRWKS